MDTLIYIILVAVCSIIVYNILCKVNHRYVRQLKRNKILLYLVSFLAGALIAGVIRFFFSILFIPLVICVVVYFIWVVFTKK